jgi:hypothetical protein
MQIEVVDDCSSHGAPVELMHRIAGDRVVVHREPQNNGLSGIWNRCIERARGCEMVRVRNRLSSFSSLFAEIYRECVSPRENAQRKQSTVTM